MYSDKFGYNRKIPKKFRLNFMWLCQDVASLQKKWDFYLELFNNENVELLAELAPGSFNIIFDTLRSDLIMSICRLNDPSHTNQYKNLSLESIIQECGDIPGLKNKFSKFTKLCEDIGIIRNKRIGHRDFNSVMDFQNNPLPPFSKSKIDEILFRAGDILNTILQFYVDEELNFHVIIVGGAKTLVYWLKRGKSTRLNTL